MRIVVHKISQFGQFRFDCGIVGFRVLNIENKHKLVVNGDPSQIDLINKSHSGLVKSKNILKHLNEIKIIEFDHNDVVRHPLVSKIVKAYSDKNSD